LALAVSAVRQHHKQARTVQQVLLLVAISQPFQLLVVVEAHLTTQVLQAQRILVVRVVAHIPIQAKLQVLQAQQIKVLQAVTIRLVVVVLALVVVVLVQLVAQIY
jgi:hypothetical protein